MTWFAVSSTGGGGRRRFAMSMGLAILAGLPAFARDLGVRLRP
ncbi:hypothetical protein [Amycolatopsis mediterranei]|nr:hypothetical protein [Amycolatopsis mediterranei]